MPGTDGSFPSLAGTGGVGTSGISLDFSGAGTINTGGTVTAPSPSITAVLDAGSNTANLAPGTIFIVKGTNLCPGTTLTAYNVPRPTTATDGVQIVFTPVAGGTGTNALIWYEDPLGSGTCQLAGILPSTVAPGNYNVTVVNGTTSAGFATTVVATKFEMFTQDSTGTGLVSAQINGSYQLIRLTTGTLSGLAISPAHPGDNVVVYGTGMGAAPTGDDNAASPDYNYLTNGYSVQVLVGGVAATVQYAGLAGYAGEIQLNFALPSNVPTGCAVTLQVIVNNVMSVPVTLAIAPSASATACVEPGYTTAQLQALDNGGTIAAGSFGITQFAENVPGEGNIKLDEASGGFTEITGFQLGALPVTVSTITQGACEVITGTSTNGVVTASGTVKNLDAGTVTLSGPSGTNLNKTALTETSDTYSLTIGDEGINIPGGLNGSIVAGTYTLAGAGGADVESFSNVQLTLGTPLAITGSLPTTIVRSQPLTISWTGGSFQQSGGDFGLFEQHFGERHHQHRVCLLYHGGRRKLYGPGVDPRTTAGHAVRHRGWLGLHRGGHRTGAGELFSHPDGRRDHRFHLLGLYLYGWKRHLPVSSS